MKLALAIITVAACSGSKDSGPERSPGSGSGSPVTAPSAAPPRGEVEIAISSPGSGSVRVGDGLGKGSYYPRPDLSIVAKVEGPPGTTIAWQGQTAKLGAEPLSITIDVLDLVLRDALNAKKHELPFVVTAPGKPAVTATMTIDAGPGTKLLLDAAKRPVPFPGDERATQKADVAAVLSDSGTLADTISAREGTIRLYDVDVVVIRTQTDRVVRDCGVYSNGTQRVRRTILARDAADAAYDRRTGTLLGAKSFAAAGGPASCEKSFDLGGDLASGRFESLDSTFSEADEHTWIAGLLTKPTGAEIDVPPPTLAGLASSGEARKVSKDPGKGFPTAENLAARFEKLGWTIKTTDIDDEPYPLRIRIRANNGTCVSYYDFGGADRQAQPTVVHVGPQRVVWATIDDPKHEPWLDKLAAKLPSMSPTSTKQLAALFAGTGLRADKDKYNVNTDDTTDDLRAWYVYGNDKEDTRVVKVHVAYWGHLAKSDEALVATAGNRVLVLGCLILPEERTTAMAKLLE